MARPVRTVRLSDEAATRRFGADIAIALRPGDVIVLEGDLGAGKTELARAIIRSLRGDPELEVPSPSYMLVQDYPGAPPVSHVDLYRIGGPAEVYELGLEETAASGILLVEWGSRAEGRLPPVGLTITMEDAGGERRIATLEGPGDVFERVVRSVDIRAFLIREGRPDAVRARLTGDASARRYEIITRKASPDRILMDSPPLVLGPPVREGKAYAELAHTARSVSAFVGIAKALRAQGVVAPEILAADLDKGFLLLQHLGSDGVLDEAGRPILDRYREAARLLARIHAARWDPRMPVAEGRWHRVPNFDRACFSIEASLLVDWYVQWKTGLVPDEAMRTAFDAAWNAVFARLKDAEKSLLLRDYHSPNLIWRRERQGTDRIGVLDFQDALMGPSAYDVASLALDARVTITPEEEEAVVAAYVEARRSAGRFDERSFAEAYAICAAQRNTKILGIFVRLKKRDGKPDYIRHLPRIRDYVRRALRHPSLAPVAHLYLAHRLLEEDRN